jgi:hypothetical protein
MDVPGLWVIDSSKALASAVNIVRVTDFQNAVMALRWAVMGFPESKQGMRRRAQRLATSWSPSTRSNIQWSSGYSPFPSVTNNVSDISISLFPTFIYFPCID